jgi:hypothetical protein
MHSSQQNLILSALRTSWVSTTAVVLVLEVEFEVVARLVICVDSWVGRRWLWRVMGLGVVVCVVVGNWEVGAAEALRMRRARGRRCMVSDCEDY